MKLSKRLELVASFVPKGSRIADIGTDHGYVPIYLAEKGICPKAIAADIKIGPLKRAEAHIRKHGLSDRIETRFSDGFHRLEPGEADTVIIAGMGGELMIHILEDGQHMWESVREFILSPQSDLFQVRRYLEKNGFQIEDEEMVMDEGKYYTVMLVKRGNMQYETAAWYCYGKRLIEKKHPVLLSFLEKEERRISEILNNLNRQHTSGADRAKADLQQQILLIQKTRREMEEEKLK